MGRSFGLVDQKVAEADFFLEKLAVAGFNFFEARCYFSAFVAAARSVTFSLQAVLAGTDGFSGWYADVQNALRNDERAKFFNAARTESQHIGVSHVSGGASFRNDDGTTQVKYFFSAERAGQQAAYPLEEDAITACKNYLTGIVRIVHQCYRRFGRIIDPDQYYTLENLRKIGLSLEDVEEELGFPRGWTFIEPGRDEERLRLLRREIPRSEIDELFEKYLGKTRNDD